MKRTAFLQIIRLNTQMLRVLIGNDSSQFKSNVHVLPLSTENNSTIAGSGAIIHEFGNMFGLPQAETNKYLPYEVSTRSFSLKQAGAHFEFKRILHDHQHEMAEYERQVTDTEKRLDAANKALNQIETEPEVEYAELLAGISFNNFEDDDLIEGVEPLQDDDFPDNVVHFAAMEEERAIKEKEVSERGWAIYINV